MRTVKLANSALCEGRVGERSDHSSGGIDTLQHRILTPSSQHNSLRLRAPDCHTRSRLGLVKVVFLRQQLVLHAGEPFDGSNTRVGEGFVVEIERRCTLRHGLVVRLVDAERDQAQEVNIHFLLVLRRPITPRQLRQREILTLGVAGDHGWRVRPEMLTEVQAAVEIAWARAKIVEEVSGAVMEEVPGPGADQVRGEALVGKDHSDGPLEHLALVCVP
jgi:hypothetical protein